MIDLHLHLDGSLEPEDMLFLAGLSDVRLPTEDASELRKLLSVEPDCENLAEYLEKFDLPLMVLQTEEAIEAAVYRLVKRLSEQGLCYTEIRFAPQLHRQRGLTQEQVVEATVKGLKRANEFMPAQLILCCMRGDDNFEENMETVRLAAEFLGKGVCAADLAGDEASHPAENYADIFVTAREKGVPFTLHAGEAAGAQSVDAALKLGALRIGHGIRSAEDEAVVTKLREKKIPLEICVTSNLHTRAVKGEYPLLKLLNAGLAVTLNTDNMTVSDTTLKKEYLLVKERFDLSIEQLKQLALNSVRAAFVSEGERAKLEEKIESGFESWIK